MELVNKKIALLKSKVKNNEPITVMIIGLGSVGTFLLDFLVSLRDPQMKIVVAGRNAAKMQMDVNIVRTAATIRRELRSSIEIMDGCDLNDVDSIAATIQKANPDFIVNSSRVYSGLKYGSISWSNLRAYGIWSPLSIRYAKNIMAAYAKAGSNAITINTSYSDAVIPWLKSAGKAYFDFGSGNLNHLIPRMKFYMAEKYNIDNLNDIDVTLAVSHFHDVVISKEGHAEGQTLLLNFKHNGKELAFNQDELLKACAIAMPVDQKRNMMNASSNFNIIDSILTALRENTTTKIHAPGVDGEIGGYPVLIDGEKGEVSFDTSLFSMDEMRAANRKSIYCDGIENVENGTLVYTDELVAKVKKAFNVDLPKRVPFEKINETADFIIKNIIEPFAPKK